MLQPDVIPIIGLPLAKGWSHVSQNKAGQLIMAYGIKGPNANNIGREIRDLIIDFNSQDPAKLHQFILDLISKVRDYDCEIQLASLLFLQDKVFLATYNGLIILKRESKIGKILNSTKELKIIQGSVNLDDVYVLGTNQLAPFVGEIKQRMLQGYDIESVVTSIIPVIHNQQNSSLSALSFIKIIKQKKKKIKTQQEDESLAERKKISQKQDTKITLEDITTQPKQIQNIPLDETKEKEPTQLKDFTKKTQPKKENQDKFKVKTKDLPKIGKKVFNFLFKGSKKIFFIIKKILIKIINILAFLIKKIFSPSQVYVDENRNLKIIKRVIVVVIIAGTIVAIFFVRSIRSREKIEQTKSTLSPFETQITEIKQKANRDLIGARKDLEEILIELNQLKKQTEDQNSLKLIDEQIVKTEQYYQEISGKEEQQKLAEYANLRDIQSDLIASDIDIKKSKMIIYDSGKNQFVYFDLSTNEKQLLPVGNEKQVTDYCLNDNKLYLLSEGIYNFDFDNQELTELTGSNNQTEQAEFINKFESFLYIFNEDKRNIYRYSWDDQNQELSDPIGWLQDKRDLDFDTVESISIDSDIWLTTTDGQILKYSRGKKQNFEIKGLDNKFENSIILYTKPDINNLYILEAEKSRFVILDKQGNFIREVTSTSLAGAVDLAVSEQNKKAYIINGSIIFEIDL